MRIYLDSSALVKRAVAERESDALANALDGMVQRTDLLVASALASVEVSRVIRSRADAEHPAELSQLVETALSGVLEAPISEQVIAIARRLGPASLRSLDAIHLATATLIDADLVVAYDRRLLEAASELGFVTAAPGTPH